MSTAVLSPINIPFATPQPIGGANDRPSSIRRRNALVPLPLLPPVPRNAIVTSVKIVHNPTPPSPTSPTDSSNSSNPSSPEEEEEVKVTNVTSTERRSVKRPSTSPTSPTQTNFYFAPLAKRPRHRRRSGSRSPKCSPPTSPTSPPGSRQYFPVIPESIKPAVPKTIKEEGEVKTEVENTEATAALRRPRSTILVTVRLASPPAQSTDTNPFDSLPPPPSSLPPTPSLRHKKPLASLSARKPRLLSIQSRPQYTREPASPTLSRMKSPTSSINAAGFGRQRTNAYVSPPPPPVPVKPKWNKPRVSSGLATTSPVIAHFEELDAARTNVELEDVMSMDVDPSMPSLYPAGILRNISSLNLTTPSLSRAVTPKKTKKGKTGSRIAMLRWALLNHSGPEVGRRIQAMGVRLAREIWEAERFADEEEESASGTVMLGRGNRQISGVIVASPTREDSMVMESAKEDEESVLPSIMDEDDAMPAIEEVMENLGLTSSGAEEERERIAEECIRELEEEMDIDEQEQSEEMEMVDPSLDRKMVNLTVSDTILENANEGRALLEADDMAANAEAKAKASTKENLMVPAPIVVEDVEMFDSKEEEKVSSTTSLPSPTTQTNANANRDMMAFGRRASLATDKLNYAHDKLAELNGNHMRRRSSLGLTEDKMPIIMAARKWFGRAIL